MPEENSDQKPPQRLQSLASRGRGGMMGGRGGRFSPNAVGRRSKEERESTAPAMKPQDQDPNGDKKTDGRNKFERRRQRQMGTRAEAAGPLAAPIIAANTRSGNSMGSVSDGSRMRTSVRIKQDPDAAMGISTLTPGQRIDMSSTDREGDAYFPVRMPREAAIKPETNITASGALPGQILDRNSSEVTMQENKYYLIQLPELGLKLGKVPETSVLAKKSSEHNPKSQSSQEVAKHESKIKTEDPDAGSEPADVSMVDANVDLDETQNQSSKDIEMDKGFEAGSAGLLGSLRTHASGKLTLHIGDTVYEIMAGSQGHSAEELLVVDDEGKEAYEMGSINRRLLMVPDLGSLNI